MAARQTLSNYDSLRARFDEDLEDACFVLRHAWDALTNTVSMTGYTADLAARKTSIQEWKVMLVRLSNAVDQLDERAERRMTRAVTKEMRLMNENLRHLLEEVSFL